MADSTGRELTFGRALVGSLLLARAIRRHVPGRRHRSAFCFRPRSAARSPTSPPSMSGRVPVNLNFTAGRDAMAAAIERCGITTMLTSRTFLPRQALPQRQAWCFWKTS